MNLFKSLFLAVIQLLLIFQISYAQDSTAVVKQNAGAMVNFDGKPLFELYQGLPPYSVEERAMIIEQRLVKLVGKGELVLDSFQLSSENNRFSLNYQGTLLMQITAEDAEILNMNTAEAATWYLENIREALKAKSTFDWIKQRAIEVGLTLLVLVLLWLIIKYLNKMFTWINRKIIKNNSSYLSGVRIRNYEFLSKDRMIGFVASILKIIKWIIILLIVYLALPIIFSIFPGTEGIATTLFGYVLNPIKSILKGFLNFIPNLVTIAVIIGVTRYFDRGLRFLSLEVQQEKLVIPGFFADWAKPTHQLLRVLLYCFSFIVIFPYLPGSESPVFQGVSVFLGILISLGSSSAISNLIAGLVITYMRAFKDGDRVKIGETTGEVLERNVLVTRLRTTKNEEVTIPNSNILNSHTINYSANKEAGLILHTTITIGYDVSWVKVQELLYQAAAKTSDIEQEPKPFVLQTSLDDFYVSYELNVHTLFPDKAPQIYSQLHSNILDAFNEANVEIMSPHYRANRDGSDITIPKNVD
ncbi:MAG: mechanosensitive ion channel family protein [Salibacteraceae bacterium]|nr:mechanosensitive ion channel family protein [Salibacteraceae bacterium]